MCPLPAPRPPTLNINQHSPWRLTYPSFHLGYPHSNTLLSHSIPLPSTPLWFHLASQLCSPSCFAGTSDPANIWPLWLLLKSTHTARMFHAILLNTYYQPTSTSSVSTSSCSWGFSNCWMQSKGYNNRVFSRVIFLFLWPAPFSKWLL